jgi:DNA-binding MarR family transcriptional regulator
MPSRFRSAWDSPGFLLWHASLRWQRKMAAALRPMALTHVQFVLLASTWWLATHGRQPSQRELADHAGTDVMMTSQVVRALQAKGLITREANEHDPRALRLALTRQGEKVAHLALAAVEYADDDYFRAVQDTPRLVGALRALAGRPQKHTSAEEIPTPRDIVRRSTPRIGR